jgi:hypothetical protein
VALGVLGCVAVRSVSPAQGYVPTPPGVGCLLGSQGNMAVLENSLSPAINTFVQEGSPVTFSGSSGAPVTFTVASSAASLSSPDLDSGLGSLQPGTSTYTFTSTKASATPGVLIFWDASFSSASLNGCEGLTPKIYTTAVRTFGVASPPPPPTMPITPTITTTMPPTASGSVSLASPDIAVQGGGVSLVKLDCLGDAGCHGKLNLSAKIASKVKGKESKKTRTIAIGTVSFSVAGDETKAVKVNLNAAGRALLSADHGRCSATLAILELAPGPANMQTKSVRLVQQKARGRAGKK